MRPEIIEPTLNDPAAYYREGTDPSLAWEMTVCQSLADRASPYLPALTNPKPYGELVADFLADQGALHWGTDLVEVGGGCGSLMAALLQVMPVARATLVDVSPFFLEHQRRAVGQHACAEFHLRDVCSFFRELDREVDLVISNENIGDLPAYAGLPRDEVLRLAREGGWEGRQDLVADAAAKVARYDLELDGAPDRFALNAGAVEYLEALAPRARSVFLTEHGADTKVPPPWNDFLSLAPSDGFPRRIPLRGHDEYSIRFSHLETVAASLGYRVRRFHLLELLGLRADDSVRPAVAFANTASEAAERVHELYHHVAEYQGLFLWR